MRAGVDPDARGDRDFEAAVDDGQLELGARSEAQLLPQWLRDDEAPRGVDGRPHTSKLPFAWHRDATPKSSGVQTAPQRGDVAPRDGHLGTVAHDQHRGPVELGAQLDRVGEVHEVRAVHAGEPALRPVLLELAERRALQEAPVVADDARVVAVRLRDRDGLEADEPLAAALRVVDRDDVRCPRAAGRCRRALAAPAGAPPPSAGGEATAPGLDWASARSSADWSRSRLTGLTRKSSA